MSYSWFSEQNFSWFSDKLSSNQLLDYIRSERKVNISALYGFFDVLCACSDGGVPEHAQDVLLFCGHAYWFEGLIMPTDGCSLCMPIIFVKSKFYEDRFFDHQKIYLRKVQQPHTQQECG